MSTESDLIQRQRELLRQARVANRTRTDAEARATAQHGQAQQQAEETLAAATQQAETAQRQAQAQADADLRKATANAQSVLEQTQNQVARRRATAADGETQAQKLLGDVALDEPYRPVHAQPAPVEPDSRAALQKAADQVAALLRDIEEAVEDLGQQRAEARAKRKALLWWVAAGLLSAPFWLWLQVGGSPPEWLLIFVSLSLIAITVGWRSWNRPTPTVSSCWQRPASTPRRACARAAVGRSRPSATTSSRPSARISTPTSATRSPAPLSPAPREPDPPLRWQRLAPRQASVHPTEEHHDTRTMDYC